MTGAFLSVAVAIVLDLFGAAFGLGAHSSGSQGLELLSGIWVIVTPLVAVFAGTCLTASIVGLRGPYLNGITVWCMSIMAGAVLAIGFNRTGAAMPDLPQLASATGMALAGLAAILGLVGAVGGSAVGRTLERHRLASVDERVPPEIRGYRTVPAQRTTAGVPPAPPSDQPELRH